MQEFLRNLLIYVLFYECCAFFCELCDFSWNVRSDAIWGRLCEIAMSEGLPSASNSLLWTFIQNNKPFKWDINSPIHSSGKTMLCVPKLVSTIITILCASLAYNKRVIRIHSIINKATQINKQTFAWLIESTHKWPRVTIHNKSSYTR